MARTPCNGPVGLSALDRRRRHDPALGLGQRDRHGFEPERLQDVAIGRIAGRRDGDALARIEKAQEREHEARRGSRGDEDALGRDRDAIGFGVVPGDAFAQRRDAERLRVADAPCLQRGLRGFAGGARSRGRGLPDLHVDDAVPSPFFRRCGGQYVHRQERRDALHAERDLRKNQCGGSSGHRFVFHPLVLRR